VNSQHDLRLRNGSQHGAVSLIRALGRGGLMHEALRCIGQQFQYFQNFTAFIVFHMAFHCSNTQKALPATAWRATPGGMRHLNRGCKWFARLDLNLQT
jgi:hypothetical protein